MNEKPTIEVGKVPVITKFIYTLGVLPTSYLMSMTYQEQVTWLCNYIQQTLIPQINEDVEAIQELQNLYELLRTYVNDYFDNLDVQEEINNKLDEMVESGELETIIQTYLSSNAIMSFTTINELKTNELLENGMTIKTLGYNSMNDGGKNTYKIRLKTNDDIIDEENIISLYDNTLVAELIKENDFIPIDYKTYDFTGTEGNHAKIWYALISSDYKPELILANNQLDSVESLVDNAFRNKSTLSINAGLFNVDTSITRGIIIKNNELLRENINPMEDSEILYMLSNGTLKSIDATTPTADIQALSPVWAVNGWYPIIKDGVDLTGERDPLDFSERSFIGQNASGDYIVGCCNGRDYYNTGMSLKDIIDFCTAINFTPYFLYNLDGGGSSQIAIKGQKVSSLEEYNKERNVANFITFKSKYARNESIFENSKLNSNKRIEDSIIYNNGIDIKQIIEPVNENVTLLRQSSSAVKYGKLVVLNLRIRTTASLSTYAHILQNLPPIQYTNQAHYGFLINESTCVQYPCYIDKNNELRLPGATPLPNGLPAGEYTFNFTYNAYPRDWD